MTARHWPSIRIGATAPDAARREAGFDLVASILDDCQPAAIEERDSDWIATFASVEARDRALDGLRGLEAHGVTSVALDLPDEDWASRSQAGLTPIRVGRLVVTPPWHASSPEVRDHPVVVVIEPSMGFGTGHHATTRLCLGALLAADPAGKRVLDVGTGSGVLALAASLLGAASVEAIDTDPDAIASARDNLALNPSAGRVALRVADAGEESPRPADLVLANLTGASLVRLASRLAGLTAPGGRLIVSGFTLDEGDEVRAAWPSSLVPVADRSEEGWGCLVLGRRD